MQPDTLIASAVFAACAVPLSLWIGFGTKRRDADDAAANVNFGQISPAEDAAQPEPAATPPSARPGDYFITVCSWCHTVTRIRYGAASLEADRILLRRGDTLQVSHGICQSCLLATEKEFGLAAHYGGGLAAGTQPNLPRPALAGAGHI